jgi:hypothetical protein
LDLSDEVGWKLESGWGNATAEMRREEEDELLPQIKIR